MTTYPTQRARQVWNFILPPKDAPLDICPNQFEQWTDERCAAVWNQLKETYESALERPIKLKLFALPARQALALFAKYANGAGMERILYHRRALAAMKLYPELQTRVAKLFHVPESEIAANGRHKRVVHSRMFIAHIMHKQGMTYPEIALRMKGRFGGHSTLIEAAHRLRDDLREGKTFEVWDGGQFVQMAGDEILERLEKP